MERERERERKRNIGSMIVCQLQSIILISFVFFYQLDFAKCAQEKSREKNPLVEPMEKVNQMLFLIDCYHGVWEMNSNEGLLSPLMCFIFLITSQPSFISQRITNIYANRFMIQCVHMTTSQLSPSFFTQCLTSYCTYSHSIFINSLKMTTLQICDVYASTYICVCVCGG